MAARPGARGRRPQERWRESGVQDTAPAETQPLKSDPEAEDDVVGAHGPQITVELVDTPGVLLEVDLPEPLRANRVTTTDPSLPDKASE